MFLLQKVVIADHDLSNIGRMERVDVLLRVDRFDHGLFIQMLWQRQLDQNTVDILFPVQGIYKLQQLLLCCLRGQGVFLRIKAHLRAGFLFIVHIYS